MKTHFKLFIVAFILSTSLAFSQSVKESSYTSKNSYKKSYSLGKQTEMVYVIDNKTEKLTNIVTYKSFANLGRETILKKYKNSSFLTGYLKGAYKEKNGVVNAEKGSLFTIIKDKNASLFDKSSPVHIDIPKKKQYTDKFEFIPANKFSPGDKFNMPFDAKYRYGRPPMSYGELKVEVIKNDKNQAILKVL